MRWFNFNGFKFILLLLLCNTVAKAQMGYQQFSIGVGYGTTIASAGEETKTASNATSISFNYHVTPFTAVSLEGQIGNLTSGDYVHDSYQKQFISNITMVALHADVQLGEFIDYSQSPFLNGIKNVYAGVGAGLLYSNITGIYFTTSTNYIIHSTNLIIPFRTGYEFKIFNKYDEPKFRVDVNYSLNAAFGSGLDGYDDPFSTAVSKFYHYFSVGVKYSFGPVRQYRKQIYFTPF
ncbi:hypothetical protein BDD43_5980 [Mucilaginibacter gracilis]|uniref:Outer membrane protein with beta-barrel domain n=2 Tax=Mucilaginibacter gracilis TaxID=423350 RepID=A0A495JCC0_9SPHI|nr:hypothetical protein BDD43_5980 [Mucilaginibacter gracilis]